MDIDYQHFKNVNQKQRKWCKLLHHFHFSAGYGFFVASQLTGDTKKIFDSIEDIVAQADEVDDKYLQVSLEFSPFVPD